MRRLLLLALTAVAASLVLAAPGGATPPTPITITVSIPSFELGIETFVTTGGVLCPTGTATDPLDRTTGYQGRMVNFHVQKLLTCDDGSGSFTLAIQAHTPYAPTDWGNWTVLSGSGAYANLHGAGTLLGVYLFDGSPYPIGIIDTYSGGVHFD